VVREEKLSEVLSEFARTLVTDFPIQAILDHLVLRIVDILPVSAAGVTLISPGMKPRYIAASNQSAMTYETLQTEVGEGPCLAAYETGAAVAVPDLRTDDLFPYFAPRAVTAGLAAVFTFPLRHGDSQLGALDLYRDTVGALDAHDMAVAQTLADVTSAYLLNAEAREDARKLSERYRESSLHDPLTGLPNRLLLTQRLEHAALRAQRSHTALALLFTDLDRFKQVNDLHGHLRGDELLVAVARRLTRLIRPSDTLARLSGDEFIILCEDLKDPSNVELLVQRIHDALDYPFDLAGVQVSVSASVGIAYAGRGEDMSTRLIQRADAAMYEVKNTGGGRRRIRDIRALARARDHLELERDLRVAFEREELAVCYQPIVRSGDGLVTGVEAFLRWTDRVRGAVPPTALVAAAEHSELMTEIGTWVLRRACADRRDLVLAHSGRRLSVTVNVSAQQLMVRGFPAAVSSVLADTGTEPEALVLDLTEEPFIRDAERAWTVLSDLKDLGVKVALDDFGTGYSALNHLRQFPVDSVKIDRATIGGMEGDRATASMVSAVVDLSHGLGLTVVAEGVESRMQRDRVTILGVDAAQGYYFAAPMRAAEFAQCLEEAADQPLYLPAPSRR
jgi:diguanylate cyclase (GGDEF)-like protein